ncbi:MAG: DUF4140 domain-containing protein [Desulfosalsimonas sp.]
MKRAIIVAAAVVIAAAVAASAGQDGQTVSSKIVESTVFFNQARIARQASARVDSGVHRLVLPIEAFPMDRNSVTAEIKGKGEILGVRTTQIPVLEPRQKKIRDLENKKDELLLQKLAIEDEIASFEKQRSLK